MKNQKGVLGVLWLVVMVVFAPVAGFFINSDVFSSRSVLVLLMWTVVLLLPYVLIGRKSLYIIAASLLFADGFVNLFHWIVLKCPLNASSIFVFLNTNFNEASEFMAIKITPLLLLYVPYVLLFVLVLRNIPRLSLKSRGGVIVWSLLWLVVAVYFTDNIVNKRFLRLAVPDVERAFASFAAESKEYSNLKKREMYSLETEMTTSDSTLVVVVIGESCNRNHMSVYGYNRNTTPRLCARDDIMVFDNVVSANSNTLRSVMNFLTENNMERNLPIDSCIHIFDVLHSSPYKSYWLSNQSPIGLWDNGVTNLARNADVKTFVNIMANSSKESTMAVSFDHNLFDPFLSALADGVKHKMVFLHLMGCHTQYNKRYPADFALYDDSGDKRTRIVNTYDNAVFYNDFIVDSIFSVLNSFSRLHPKIRISAIYFSDHGENVYDEGDYSGHDYSDRIPNANVEIPFILWLSPSQRESLTTLNPLLMQRLHTPYMIDDLFHTILEMGCINTPAFDKGKSLINIEFDSTRRRVLEDGREYRYGSL